MQVRKNTRSKLDAMKSGVGGVSKNSDLMGVMEQEKSTTFLTEGMDADLNKADPRDSLRI